jgi:hypothetical protein
MVPRARESRTATLVATFAALLILLVLVIDWSLALTGVTAAIIGGLARVVLPLARP